MHATLVRSVAGSAGEPVTARLGPACVAWARYLARGPDTSHVNPMICAWAAQPRRVSRGLCARLRVDARVQGPTCEQHTMTKTETTTAQTQSVTTGRYQRCSPRWSAVWRPHRHQSGGITPFKAPTRRRHAARRLRMAQNPNCHAASKPAGWHTPPNWIGNSNLDTLLRSG